jgi:hypothetical protein
MLCRSPSCQGQTETILKVTQRLQLGEFCRTGGLCIGIRRNRTFPPKNDTFLRRSRWFQLQLWKCLLWNRKWRLIWAVSRWLPTAAARVRARVWLNRICGGQFGAGAGFFRVLRFPLPILIPHSSSSIIRDWYSKPNSGWRTKGTQSHHTNNNKQIIKNKRLRLFATRMSWTIHWEEPTSGFVCWHCKRKCEREALFSAQNYWEFGLWPSSGILKNTTFRELNLFPSSGEEWLRLALSKGPNLLHLRMETDSLF